MKTPSWLVPTIRLYALPALAVALYGVVVWRTWPIGPDLVGDIGTLIWGLLGVACVAAPNEVVSNLTLRGQGYSSFTAREARSFEDADAVRLIGFVIVLDALCGVGKWLVWTWW